MIGLYYMIKPTSVPTLRHVALTVTRLDDCLHFYQDIMGMKIDWQPDPDNIYLTSGTDNLALHRAKTSFKKDHCQVLDHIGFVLNNFQAVDDWHAFFKQSGVMIKAQPRTHRDGSRSFYCEDPDGNLVQMMALSDQLSASS